MSADSSDDHDPLSYPTLADATPEELADEETRISYQNILNQQKFLSSSEEDSRLLTLQQMEIEDFLRRKDELGRIEYFDIHYWTEEAQKCWGERKSEDMSPTRERPCAVRLFPSESAILKQKELRAKLNEDHALNDREELRKRHPLLFNRVVRDENRRALFQGAMEARRFYHSQQHLRALPSSGPSGSAAAAVDPLSSVRARGGSTVADTLEFPSSALTVLKANEATTKPFARAPYYIADSLHRVTDALEIRNPLSKLSESVTEAMEVASKTASDATAPPLQPTEEKSLIKLMEQQRMELEELRRRDECVYRPLLQRYFDYNEVVYHKLDRFAEQCGVHSPPPEQS